MRHPHRQALVRTLLSSFVGTVLLAMPLSRAIAQPAPVELRILAINDLHGNLRPSSGGIRIADPDDRSKKIVVPAGGVETMATVVQQLREGHSNTIFVAAGDLIGASPFLSAMFSRRAHPSRSLSMMGLGIASVGNHEFDEGKDELLRKYTMAGCHPARRLPRVHCIRSRARSFTLSGGRLHHRPEHRRRSTLFPPYEIREFEAHPGCVHRPDALKGTVSQHRLADRQASLGLSSGMRPKR